MRQLFCAILLLISSAVMLSANEEKDLATVRVGIIATDSSDNLRSQWSEFLDEFAKQTGYAVEPFFAPDYAGIVEAMRFDQIEIAYLGNAAAILAVDRAGGEVFVQRVNPGYNIGYHTLMIVHRDSDLHTLDDVIENAGRLNAALGDANSTSGYLVPDFYIFQRRGIVPQQAFRNVTHSSHDAMLLAVANKQADFATISSFQPARTMARDPEAVSSLRTVWRSPLIPSSPMVWRTNLPEVTKNKIRGFFIGFGVVGDADKRSREQAILSRTSGGMEVWRASDNHQLIPIRQLELAKQRTQIQQRDGLSAADRDRQLAAIDAQIKELDTLVSLLEKGL
ncbi:MAG: phosphate/phosphite/phosphonate ABC transporter substrate-binding protein [Planctomycetota bacterium]|nr:MAG: phosphate/phosphite/phosphonate ABC transporter substrate-binding protein [Planctomycetota bacterium]